MKSRKENRVTFYSKTDLAGGSNLTNAEPILRNFDSNSSYDLNDLIELYQIKQYIDNDLFLTSWTENDKEQFKERIISAWSKIIQYWQKINDKNFLEIFESVEIGYQPAFWELIEKTKAFKNIPKISFEKILTNSNLWIREVLQQKNLVKHFGQEIRNYLLETENSAELLLTQYEEHHEEDFPILYFPDCLTNADKEQIINRYLDFQEANVNYVRLITKSRDVNLKLSPHTRLKAKRVAEELNDKILENGATWIAGNEVSLQPDQDEPVKITWEGNIQKISYSIKWLDEQKDDLSLIQNFSLLFNYIDIFGCITLISKDSELDVIEKTLMRSKNEYISGASFSRKSNLSHLQLFLYTHYLKQIDKTLEGILSSFVNNYIVQQFKLTNFKIHFPSENTSYLEKVRLIVPEIESILKQYKLFVEDRVIDHDLLQMSSHSINYGEVPSLLKNKYAYGIGDEFLKLKYYFFSDQSMLAYIEPYKTKYRNLYSLLLSEKVKLTDFKSYQKSTIENLIQDGYLIIDSDEYVKMKEKIQLFVIGKIAKDEVISYWHFSDEIRSIIDSMNENGLLYFSDTLFSESEKRYFNYYLNKSEYTNGLDLRNKYAHGTNAINEEEQKNDYLTLLKLLVLILLKIENDLLLYDNNK